MRRMLYTIQRDSPLGKLTLAAGGQGLAGLWMEGQRRFGGGHPLRPARREELETFRPAEDWLERYFSGEKPQGRALTLCPEGTPFQHLVWSLLLDIPWGETVTYGELARGAAERLGRESMSPQAVGGAVGRNPISIIIPCHRVVGAEGSLTGYAGGLERKRWLLAWEGCQIREKK